MKKTVLLLYSNYSTFVEKDEIILKKKFNVVKYQFESGKNLFQMTVQLLKQLYFTLLNINKIDFVYSWFSDFYSLIPFLLAKLFKKKTYVVVGGFDAASIPELNYGLFHKKNTRQFFGVLTYKLSDYILPVDESLIKSINYYFNSEGVKVGVKNYVPNLNAKIKVIPTDFDYNYWKKEDVKKEKSVIAYGYAPNMQKFIGKGNDLLIEAAKEMPDTTFNIYGLSNLMLNYASKSTPKNVKLHGNLNKENIIKELSKHKVYALFSMSEGMPNSLCEAMLCECISVGSNVGGIKNIIGDCGYILNYKNVDEAVNLLNQALESESQASICSRERIIKKFPKGIRETELFKIID